MEQPQSCPQTERRSGCTFPRLLSQLLPTYSQLVALRAGI